MDSKMYSKPHSRHFKWWSMWFDSTHCLQMVCPHSIRIKGSFWNWSNVSPQPMQFIFGDLNLNLNFGEG